MTVINNINPRDFINLIKKSNPIIIDIREPFELLELPFEGTKNIPMYTLLNNFTDILDKKDDYYILCHHGQRSFYVTEVLHNRGYKVINVIGGIDLVNKFDRSNS